MNEKDLDNDVKNRLEDGKKVLILGCGISNHETFSYHTAAHVVWFMFNYQNLTLSDLDINSSLEVNGQQKLETLWNKKNFKNEIEKSRLLVDENTYQTSFPESHKKFKDLSSKLWYDDFFGKTFEESRPFLIRRRIIDHIKERFIPFNLLSKNSDWKTFNEYDYIDLRYVLHFKLLKRSRVEIIKRIYDNMKSGAELGIQCYYNITDGRKDIKEYATLSQQEIEEIRKMSTSKEIVVEYFSVGNGNEAVKIIMTK